MPQTFDGVENCHKVLVLSHIFRCSDMNIFNRFLQLVECCSDCRAISSRRTQVNFVGFIFHCLKVVENVAGFRHETTNNRIIQSESL